MSPANFVQLLRQCVECKSNYKCRGTVTISALETGNFKGGAKGAQVPLLLL